MINIYPLTDKGCPYWALEHRVYPAELIMGEAVTIIIGLIGCDCPNFHIYETGIIFHDFLNGNAAMEILHPHQIAYGTTTVLYEHSPRSPMFSTVLPDLSL
jgi:hypothetical protein